MKDKHPAIAITTTSQRRRVVLVRHPRLQVIDIIGTRRGERQDIAATARYFGIGEDEVQAVLRYYADSKYEVDEDLKMHLEAQQNHRRELEQ